MWTRCQKPHRILNLVNLLCYPWTQYNEYIEFDFRYCCRSLMYCWWKMLFLNRLQSILKQGPTKNCDASNKSSSILFHKVTTSCCLCESKCNLFFGYIFLAIFSLWCSWMVVIYLALIEVSFIHPLKNSRLYFTFLVLYSF